jgi:hypothetical protein
MYKRLYGVEPNYSERFNAALLQIRCPGTDPQKTYEGIRHDGLVDARDFPMPDTLEEFLDKSEISGSLMALGQHWLVKHDFMHEWLWSVRPKNYLDVLKHALTTSPIACTVTAWHQKDGKYVDNGQRNNHWVVCYRIDQEGIHIFDSYDHSTKILSLDHNISRAKRIWLNRKTPRYQRKQISLLQAIIKRFMKPDLVDVATSALGTDVTPDDLVPDVVACAITVSTLINKLDPTFPKVSGTWTLYDVLEHRKNWQKVNTPTTGCVVISPTGLGMPGTNGHVGIYMPDGTIASNDSRTGKFIKNYNLETWQKRYASDMRYPVYFYQKV